MIRCPFCRTNRVLSVAAWNVKARPKRPRCVCTRCLTMFAYPIGRGPRRTTEASPKSIA